MDPCSLCAKNFFSETRVVSLILLEVCHALTFANRLVVKGLLGQLEVR